MESNEGSKRFSRRYDNPFASRWIGGIGQHFMKAAITGGAGALGTTAAAILMKKTPLGGLIPAGMRGIGTTALTVLLGRLVKGINFRMGPMSTDMVGDAMSTVAVADLFRGMLKAQLTEMGVSFGLSDEIELDDEETLGSTEWYKQEAPAFGDEYFADDDDLSGTERENVEAPAFG